MMYGTKRKFDTELREVSKLSQLVPFWIDWKAVIVIGMYCSISALSTEFQKIFAFILLYWFLTGLKHFGMMQVSAKIIKK